mgnify:CR=1 FL=1
MFIDTFDTRRDCIPVGNQHRNKFGGVDRAVTQFSERSPSCEASFLKLRDIHNPAHGGDCKATHMRGNEDRLGLVVANDTDTQVAGKRAQAGFKLISEVSVFKPVDGALKTFFGRVYHHTGSLGAEMRMIVGSVEDIGDATRF